MHDASVDAAPTVGADAPGAHRRRRSARRSRTGRGLHDVGHVRDSRRGDDRLVLATGEPLGKAGAYALQGAGAALVSSVDGSVSNVIGLPLHLVVDLAGRLGVTLLTERDL